MRTRTNPKRVSLVVGRRRGGLALLLVLGVVAVASVLGWAMLSASAMRAQVETTTADGLDASMLAESGASYAMYYALHPDKSPKAIAYDANNGYTSTTTGMKMWSDARGTVDVTTTAAGDGTFTIASATTVNGIHRSLIATAVNTYDTYKVTHALGVNSTSSFVLPYTVTINGAIVSRGGVSNEGAYVTPSQTVKAAGANVVPAYADLKLYQETGVKWTGSGSSSDGTYTYNGVTYRAEKISSNSISAMPTRVNAAQNPMSVFCHDGDLTISKVTFNGTLVLRSGKLTVLGTNTITPAATDIPALICDSLDMKSSALASQLTVNGVLWCNGTITNSQRYTTSGGLYVNGALLLGGPAPKIDYINFGAPIKIVYANSVASIPQMSTIKTTSGISVRSWQPGS